MPAIPLLTDAERDAALADLTRWRYEGGAIRARFAFPDFSAAWGFMTRVALLAESRDHHPDWSNVYGRVDVALTTHDAGGVTARDTEFARAIEALAG